MDMEGSFAYDRVERILTKIRSRITISDPESALSLLHDNHVEVQLPDISSGTGSANPDPSTTRTIPVHNHDVRPERDDVTSCEPIMNSNRTPLVVIPVESNVVNLNSDPMIPEPGVTNQPVLESIECDVTLEECDSTSTELDVGSIEPDVILNQQDVAPQELIDSEGNLQEHGVTLTHSDTRCKQLVDAQLEVGDVTNEPSSAQSDVMSFVEGNLEMKTRETITHAASNVSQLGVSHINVEKPIGNSKSWVKFDERHDDQAYRADTGSMPTTASPSENFNHSQDIDRNNSAQPLAQYCDPSPSQTLHSEERFLPVETRRLSSQNETSASNEYSNGNRNQEMYQVNQKESSGRDERVSPANVVVMQPGIGGSAAVCMEGAGNYSSDIDGGLIGLEADRSHRLSLTTLTDSDALLPKSGDWSTGLCRCQHDCGRVCYADFCLPCSVHELASEMGETDTHRPNCCVQGYLRDLRTRMRQQLDIRGNQSNDCCVAYWCPACVIAQMEREIRIRGNL